MALPTIPWPRHLCSIGFVLLWLAILLGLHARIAESMAIPEAVRVQVVSWLTFFAVFITPGWLIAEILTWHLDLDWLERLALAFPLGVAVMAVPGMAALLWHLTLAQLNILWIAASAAVVVAWVIHLILRRSAPAQSTRWTMDEVILAVLLLAAFIYLLPTLNAYKIDGDAYAVATFAADALAGLPLNAREPLFGTNLGPGVRMAFNQSLTMSYLWSYLGQIDPITLTATASRSMIALWIMLSAYALGKTAGISSFGRAHGRRFGLFMAWLQTIIFIAAPFLRGDNVSLFFFERTTADKFMVPMTMLPVGFAFALRYLADGKQSAWWTAALIAFSVSTIHPLIAAMMALGLAAFAGFHWLMHWRTRTVILRSLAVAGLVAIVMVLPIVQLVLSRGEEPLAPSYPTSLENWPIGYKREPIFPFFYVPSMTVIGPLPDLVQLQASDANTVTNPFLIWRFAVNMDRRRLILFDLNHYISDPNLLLEPPYLLALLLLPFLLRKLRVNLAAQFALSTALAILFVMFNPWLTPLIGALVMPWILWRFVWLLPYALIIALVLYRLLSWCVGWARERVLAKPIRGARWALLAFVVIVSLLVSPVIGQNLQELRNRSAFPYFFPAPTKIFAKLQTLTLHTTPKTVMADQDVSVTLPAYVANANVVAHRMPTTSEIFPAKQQEEALQRLIDQAKFYRARYLTVDTVNILKRYHTGFVIAASGSDLEIQLRSASEWFTWVMNDQSYSLYAVQKQPETTDVINGNTALVERQWAMAENFYRAELTKNPKSALALLGLAEIAHVKGRFTNAIALLNQAVAQADQPFFHYRLGQIYAEMGQSQPSIAEFTKAQTAAPDIARFNLALGDACLAAEQNQCAVTQFAAAVANGNSPDAESRQVALADLWRQRGQTARSIPLYEQAVASKPGIDNQLMLASVYQEAGRFSEAETLLSKVQAKHPLSSEALTLAAVVKAKQTKASEATALYQRAIWLQDIQGWDSIDTHLALAQALLEAKQADPARKEIEHVLAIDPNNALAYNLQGTLDLQQNQLAAATQAYQQSFRLDPSRVGTYIALSSQLREEGGQQDEMTALLQRAIKASPDEALLAMALGDQLERQGDTQAAIDAYHSALDLLEEESQPNKFNIRSQEISRAYAYTRLAGVSEEIGQIEPATNYYAAAVAAVPNLAWPQLLLGDASLRQGDMTAAETAYTRAMSNDATAVEPYLRLVDLYEARGDPAKAEVVQQRALQVALANSAKTALTTNAASVPNQQQAAASAKALASDETLLNKSDTVAQNAAAPSTDAKQVIDQLLNAGNLNLADNENGNLFRLVAHLYQIGGQTDLASQLYQQLIKAGKSENWHPATLASYHKGLADVYLAQNQPTLAVDAYQQAIALDNWWPQPRLGLARALADLGKSDEAIAQLRSTVSIAPGYVEAQVALASALDHQGAHDEALTIYATTAAIHAGNALATLALAHAWQDRGQWDKAEQSYRNTVAMNRGSSDAYVGLASILIDHARYDEAQKLLDKALGFDHQNVNIYIQSGVMAQRRGDATLALEWFDKATNLRLNDPSISLTLVDLLQRSGNYETALTYIKERLQERPKDADLLLRLAEIQRTQGRYADALRALLTVERADHTDSRVGAELGELYLAQGQPSVALAIYRSALNVQPNAANYYLKAAELWSNQANLDRAVELLKIGLTKATQPAALYAAIAKIELQRGQPEAAHTMIEQGLKKVGEETDLVTAMGDYLSTKDSNQAEQWYHEVLIRKPHAAGIYIALGNLALRNDKLEDALVAFHQALTLSPTNAGYYVVLGNAFETAKQMSDALVAYRQAIALEPTLVDAYASLAALYQKQQKWEDAQATFDRGIAIAPTDGLLHVQYAAFLLKRDQKDKALTLLDEAGKLSPTRTMLVARAAVYKSLDQKEDAQHDLQAALQLEPGSLDVLLALNQLYRELGQAAKAQLMLDKAVQLNPDLKKK